MKGNDLYATSTQLQDYIASVRWRTAKDGSHQYTVVHWVPEKEKQFRALVATIYEKGYKEKFQDRTYTYLTIDDYTYWSMNYRVEATILINRRIGK
jgi:hypothetical protein